VRGTLTLWIALSAPLAAQSVRARLEGRVPAASIPIIDSLVRVAAHENLPTDPLVQKAIEGGAKRVSGERIVKAVVLNLDQLRAAQALLQRAGDKPPATPAEVVTVVAARKRGLAESQVERVVAALPDQPRGSALHAIADLVAHRFDADSATDIILEAVRKGVRGVRLLDVSSAAVQELQRGRTRTEALALVRQVLPNVPLPPPPARATVLHARRPAATAQQSEQ
jgi:hypothetical protein